MSSQIKRENCTTSEKFKLVSAGNDLPIAYHIETSDKVIDVLEQCRKNRTRIILSYGDVKTGKDWHEVYDTTGRIGLSRGFEARFPILLKQNNSIGGGGLLENCILKIRDIKGNVLYKAKNYQQDQILIVPSDIKNYSHAVTVNGEIFTRHKTERGAKLLQKRIS